MISLFFGEFCRLSLTRRLVLIPLGFLSAMAFNACRASLLTFVAAKNGLEAISHYHDPAGVTITVACTLSMWGLALVLARCGSNLRRLRTGESMPANEQDRWCEEEQRSRPGATGSAQPLATAQSCGLHRLSIGLLVWLIGVETGVESWYRIHENRSSTLPEWAVSWPPPQAGFQELSIPSVSRDLLKFDEGHAGIWSSESGAEWQAYYLRWLPGRLAISAARSHNPSICLAASGKVLNQLDQDRVPIRIGPIVFPFRRYEFTEVGHVVRVFHCLWEERAAGAYFDFDPNLSLWQLRLRPVLEGRRNCGQRSLEFLIRGIEDAEAAETALIAQLRTMIKVADPR
jgi:exosortase/archaeosortase family protein